MKRYSTLLLLACWLVILFVISTLKISMDYSKQKSKTAGTDYSVPSGMAALNSL